MTTLDNTFSHNGHNTPSTSHALSVPTGLFVHVPALVKLKTHSLELLLRWLSGNGQCHKSIMKARIFQCLSVVTLLLCLLLRSHGYCYYKYFSLRLSMCFMFSPGMTLSGKYEHRKHSSVGVGTCMMHVLLSASKR